MAQAATLAERARLIEQATMILQRRIGELEGGEVDPARRLLNRRLTKEIDDYAAETRTALAARQLADAGVKVHPGERQRFVVREAKARGKSRRVHAEGLEAMPVVAPSFKDFSSGP
jgi:DNA polymerase I